MDELIKRLREYAAARKGEIAGLTNEAADAIEELVGKTDTFEWIPVTERLPSEEGFTLIFTAHGHAGVCYFTNGWWGGYDKNGITHWMPLPEPPKEE